ncbi:unnamed protein product [Bursaphelenchus okinawaensis]|uniref:Tyrosine-protein kinase n=1 Tax=Bursaphelenchus okinawaensis TaxID=465554 RepID=A0A811JUV1_9BILA|nr:unnamed protein product [Bursaphelenchus okinawaensis]CAG9084317.1 unnamed protein product [Bursaphelenchus okinawaensis]
MMKKDTKACPIAHEPYFLGVLPRINAESCLLKKGDFGVRIDVKKKSFVTMIKGESSVHHERLSDEGGRWFSVRKPKRKFNTIQEFVKHHKKNAFLFDGEEVTVSNVNTRPFWMLPKSELQLEKTVLGTGEFSTVQAGSYKRLLKLAVKICKDTGEDDEVEEQNAEMVMEAIVMKDFKHMHVINFYGISCDESPIMIAMEFCPGGSLSSHLKKQLDAITVGERVRYCYETAVGMEFLHTKQLIHRDLAARNVLISQYGLLKISDFGMSKVVNVLAGERVRNHKKPLRWTAPEAISDDAPCYSWASDVWAWGVMLYEIFGNGAQPFAAMDNNKVTDMIGSCKMMPMPEKTPEDIQEMNKKGIFVKDTKERLTFAKIVVLLKSLETKHPPPALGQATVFQLPGVESIDPKDLEQILKGINRLFKDKAAAQASLALGKTPSKGTALSNSAEDPKQPRKKGTSSAESCKTQVLMSKGMKNRKIKSPDSKKPRSKTSKPKKKSLSSTASDEDAKGKQKKKESQINDKG